MLFTGKAGLRIWMETAVYDEIFRTEGIYWWFRGKRSIVRHLMEKHGPGGPDKEILDIGCGCGYTIVELRKHYHNVHGLDSHVRAIEYCRERDITVIKGDFPNDLPPDLKSYDVILMLDVLEHIDEDAQALARAQELLKPGGIIIVTVPAYMFLWAPRDTFHHHKRRYTRKGMHDLFRGLPLEKVVLGYYDFFLAPLIMVSRLLSRFRNRENDTGEIHMLPGPINTLLEKIFSAERHLLGSVPLPFGISVIALYRKPFR
jgi:SAM-dependent methyltransferase